MCVEVALKGRKLPYLRTMPHLRFLPPRPPTCSILQTDPTLESELPTTEKQQSSSRDPTDVVIPGKE